MPCSDLGPHRSTIETALRERRHQCVEHARTMHALAKQIDGGVDHPLFAPGERGVAAAQRVADSYESEIERIDEALRFVVGEVSDD